MGKKIIFSEKQIKDIVLRYENGQGTPVIGEVYNVSQQSINRLLKKQDINVSNRKHNFNESIFNKIDNADKAYWLGFILADGYVHEKRGVMRIKLQECDEPHLRKFIDFIGGDHGMIKYEFHNITGNKQYYAEVNSRVFVNSLVSLNVRQGKSNIGRELSDIPHEFIKDYIRGMWDGDGHMDLKRCDLISSVEVLKFVQQYLHETCNTNVNKILDHCNTYRIYICKNREIVLRHLYYENCTSLERKYDTAIKIVENLCRLEPNTTEDSRLLGRNETGRL